MERKKIKRKQLIILLILAAVLTCCDGAGPKKQKVKILTGPEQGIYNEFMERLGQRLQDEKDESRDKTVFKVDENLEIGFYSSPGSIFNLELLSQGQADFAVAQADVIADALAKKKYEFQGVAPLFREYVFVFRLLPKTDKPRVVTFNRNKIRDINIPDRNSGTHLTAERLLKLSGIQEGEKRRRGVREALRQEARALGQGKKGGFLIVVMDKNDPLIRDVLDGRLDGMDSSTGSISPVWLTDGKPNHITSFYQSLEIELYPPNLIGLAPWDIPWNIASHMSSHTASTEGEQPEQRGYPVEFVSLDKTVTDPMLELYGIYETTDVLLKTGKNRWKGDVPSITTLYMRAFLVTRSDERRRTVGTVLQYLAQDEGFRRTMKTGESSPSASGIAGTTPVSALLKSHNKWPLPIHAGAYETLAQKRIISQSRQWQYRVWIYLGVLIIFITLLSSMIFKEWMSGKRMALSRTAPIMAYRLRRYIDRGRLKVLFCFILVLLVFGFAAWFIRDIESIASGVFGYDTPFNKMGLTDTVMWLAIFIIIGPAQSIFPSDPGSQVIIVLLNFTVKIIVPVIAGVYFFKMLQKKSRYKKRDFSNHVVFVGWNKNYGPLIKKIVDANKSFNFVIVTEGSTGSLEEQELPTRNVSLVQGSPLDEKVFKNAGIDEATCVYFVCETEDNECLLGLSVALKKYMIKNCQGTRLQPNLPDIYVLDPPANFKASLQEQDIKILDGPIEYDNLIESLFFGNGINSLLSHWVEQCFKRKHHKNNNGPVFFAKKLSLENRRRLKKIEKKWKLPKKKMEAEKENGKSPFKKLLEANSNSSFINAYYSVEFAMRTKRKILLGVAVKCKESNENMEQEHEGNWYYFSSPKSDDNGTVEFKNYGEAVLFYSDDGGK